MVIYSKNKKHHPAFIMVTKSGVIIYLDLFDDSQSKAINRQNNSLGREWAAASGAHYRYFMLSEDKGLPNTCKLEEAWRLIMML